MTDLSRGAMSMLFLVWKKKQLFLILCEVMSEDEVTEVTRGDMRNDVYLF